MEINQYTNIENCLYSAKDRISFLACMFLSVNSAEIHLDEESVAGLVQILWDTNETLDKAKEFLKKGAPAKADNRTEAPNKADQEDSTINKNRTISLVGQG